MRFVLLGGGLSAARNGRLLELGPPKQRLVLAALLADEGRVVPARRLIDRVWGADAPAGVSSTLYSYLARLRRVLAEGAVLDRAGGGYRLSVPDAAVDLWEWERLLREASDARGAGRARALDGALKLWRGRPLGDLEGAWVDELRAHLERQRRDALAEWAQLRLAAGDAAEVARSLAQPVREQPLAEGLVAAQVQALHQAGRTAEALECYARTRDRTIEELGVEPGALLRGIYLELLRADEAAAPPPTPHPVPAQLPAAVSEFTGRIEALRSLDKRAAATADAAPAVVITAIAGTAGVGKTTLAVHWAHQVAHRFPDGQLYLNLNGYAANAPVPPAQALEFMLRTLGVAGDKIPDDVEAKAALYRTRLAGRRMLIVLDNANSPQQVRPLLPGDPACLVLVTSRDTLAGLVAVDGAHRIELDVLDDDEAIDLLARLLGADRRAAERADMLQLAQMCARLPLALRIAAANVGRQPIAAYLRALQADRLGELVADGDAGTAVRTQFDHSYQHLDHADQRVFRLLGLVPGPEVDAYAAAALADCGLQRAARTLRRLANAHLLDQHAPGRYTCHDLLRAYARRRTDTEDDTATREAAVQRLFVWYLRTAARAVSYVAPGRTRLPELPPLERPILPLDTYEQSVDWLEAERANLLASITEAADRKWHDHTWKLPQTLWRYFLLRGYMHDWERTHRLALEATRLLSDRWAEAEILHSMAVADRKCGRHRHALDHFRAALVLRRQVGDAWGEATTLNGLGIGYYRAGDFARALSNYEGALALFRDIGNPAGEGDVLNNLGNICERLGRYPDALEYYDRSLGRYREINDLRGVATIFSNRGIVYGALGRHSLAVASIQEAVDMHRALGDRPAGADAFCNLGDIYLRIARYDAALDSFRQALRLVQDLGDVKVECEIRNGLGQAFRATGDLARALAEHQRALAFTRTSGDSFQRARAHHGIADVRHAAGEHAAASVHWQAARKLYSELGVPEAGQLCAEVETLTCGCRKPPARRRVVAHQIMTN